MAKEINEALNDAALPGQVIGSSRSYQDLTREERKDNPSEEILADVRRSIRRTQKIGTIRLQSSPQIDAEVVLEMIDDRLIFISFTGDCEP